MVKFKKIVTIASFIVTIVTIINVLMSVIRVAFDIDLLDAEELDYLGVSYEHIPVGQGSQNLSDYKDYKVVSSKLEKMLKTDIGGQKTNNDCLEYACKYTGYILNQSPNTHYDIIGCPNEQLLLEVVAKEIKENNKPVLTRVVGAPDKNKKRLFY